jgi:GNAT superfamily N-acetyltransferase
MEIRKFSPKDVDDVHRLIMESFQEFVRASFSEKGSLEFAKFQEPSKLVERAKTSEILVAEEKRRIVGIVGRKDDHVFSLFVEKSFHGKGIASLLLKKSEANALNKGFTKVKVRSSLYAVGFYQKQGYKKSTGVITSSNGITFQPMIHHLR